MQLLFKHQGEHVTQWAAIPSIAEKFGMPAEKLRKRVRRAEVDGGHRPGVISAEAQRIKELGRENGALRRASDPEGAVDSLRGSSTRNRSRI